MHENKIEWEKLFFKEKRPQKSLARTLFFRLKIKCHFFMLQEKTSIYLSSKIFQICICIQEKKMEKYNKVENRIHKVVSCLKTM